MKRHPVGVRRLRPNSRIGTLICNFTRTAQFLEFPLTRRGIPCGWTAVAGGSSSHFVRRGIPFARRKGLTGNTMARRNSPLATITVDGSFSHLGSYSTTARFPRGLVIFASDQPENLSLITVPEPMRASSSGSSYETSSLPPSRNPSDAIPPLVRCVIL